MEPKEIIKRLQLFENRFPVEKLEYEGVNFWPLLRMHFAWKLFETKNVESNEKFDSVISVKFLFFKKLIRIFRKFINLILIILQECCYRFCFLPRSYIALLSWNHHRTAVYSNRDFNPYTDSLSLIFEEGGYSNLTFEQSFREILDKRIWSPRYIRFSKFLSAYNSIRFFYFFKKSNEVEINIQENEYLFFQKECRETIGVEIEQPEDFLKLFIRDSNYRIQNYKRILSILSPRVIVLYCFYDIENLLLTKAGKELNIPVIEMQHGRVRNHWAYEMLSKTPEAGRSWIPGEFWLWDVPTREYLKQIGIEKFIHLKVIGNPWIFLNVKEKNDFYDGSNLAEKISINSSEINILITLQGKGIPEYLKNAIRESDDKIKWFVRVHPRYREDESCYDFLSSLSEKVVDWQLTSNAPLYYLLPKMDYHITFYSVVCLEADYFGVKNLVMDPLAMESYDTGVGDYALVQSKESILLSIQYKNSSKNKENNIVDSKFKILESIKPFFYS